MKLTIFLSFLFTISASASTYGQSQKVSLSANNISVKEILRQIEKQSDYFFFYKAENIENLGKRDVNFDNATIEEVLNELLGTSKLTYKVIDNYIAISPGEKESAVPQPVRKVSGKVTSEDGELLPGVSVIIKGTTSGTTTDINGYYTLDLPNNATTLVFSFIGMKSNEIVVANQTSIDVKMLVDAIGLDEVVAVGYGVSKRSSVTGSISSVKAEDLPTVANSSVTNMLSGKASGVMIKQNSAQPGGGLSVVIRGAGSLQAGNEPLYVIDGFPVNNNSVEPESGRYSYGSRNPLSSLNPNDIASIEILKDASSTAIYGARAANGVILITTKRGEDGKAKVEFSYNQSLQKISKYFDMLDAKGFMQQSNLIGKEQYYINNGLYPYGKNDPDMSARYVPLYSEEEIANAGKGTDWWDEVTRPGRISEYNVSVSGGSKMSNYMTSVNYFDQRGVVEASDFKRFTARLNLDQKINNFIKVGVSATGSQIENSNVQLGEGQFEMSGVLMAALVASPLVPIYDAYGEYKINPNNAVLPNPYSFRDINDNTLSKRLMANSYIEIQPLTDLSFKVSVGIDDKKADRDTHMPKTFLYGAQEQTSVSLNTSTSTDYLFNSVLTYNKVISDKHQFGLLLGYEYQKFTGNGFGTSNNKFFTDVLGAANIGIAEGTAVSSSYKNESMLASYFGRLNYNYDDRFMATFSLRRDGTSNFGENNKWGIFPSSAVAWRISQEQFMSDLEEISNLKLRLSYGQTGNSGIGTKAFELYSTKGYYIFGGSPNVGVGKSQLANPNLKWETTTEFNLGLDLGLFGNRISASFEYFNRVADDLLSQRQLPTYSDVRTIADNVGATQIKGMELELETRNIDKKLKWVTNLNISRYRDSWKRRNPDVILNPWQGEHDPIRAIYGYVSDGIVQIGEDIPHMMDELPGNLIYKDLNGFDENGKLTGMPDGKLDDADIVLLASQDPGLSFGLGNTFEYKGFDLTIFFYGMADRTLRNSNALKFKYNASRLVSGENNMMTSISDLWTMDNLSQKHPGLAPQAEAGIDASDYLLEDASFLRLRNVTLGYQLPKRWLKDKLEVRTYFDAQNLWTLTNYTGVDPETDSMGAYPNQTTFSFGVHINY